MHYDCHCPGTAMFCKAGIAPLSFYTTCVSQLSEPSVLIQSFLWPMKLSRKASRKRPHYVGIWVIDGKIIRNSSIMMMMMMMNVISFSRTNQQLYYQIARFLFSEWDRVTAWVLIQSAILFPVTTVIIKGHYEPNHKRKLLMWMLLDDLRKKQ